MPNTAHSGLTGSNLHEPKGADAAAADTVYKADGAGSGSFTNVNADEVQLTDSGDYFTGTQVEAALQEAGAILAAVDPKFGEMYITGNSTATTISVGATYYQVTSGWAAGVLEDVTFSSDHLVLPADGTYVIFASISFEGATGDTFKFDFHVDTGGGYSPVAKGAIRRKTANADVGAIGIHTYYAGTSGDKIAIFVQNEGSTNNATITDATLSIMRVKA